MRVTTAMCVGIGLTVAIGAVSWSNAALARDHGRTRAAIGGFVAGSAITAALSPHKTVVYSGIYGPPWGPPPYPTDSFSPAAGVVCYSISRTCYRMGGGYSPKWTWDIFAR